MQPLQQLQVYQPVYGSIETNKQYFAQLPIDIIHHILSFLDRSSLSQAFLVNRNIHQQVVVNDVRLLKLFISFLQSQINFNPYPTILDQFRLIKCKRKINEEIGDLKTYLSDQQEALLKALSVLKQEEAEAVYDCDDRFMPLSFSHFWYFISLDFYLQSLVMDQSQIPFQDELENFAELMDSSLLVFVRANKRIKELFEEIKQIVDEKKKWAKISRLISAYLLVDKIDNVFKMISEIPFNKEFADHRAISLKIIAEHYLEESQCEQAFQVVQMLPECSPHICKDNLLNNIVEIYLDNESLSLVQLDQVLKIIKVMSDGINKESSLKNIIDIYLRLQQAEYSLDVEWLLEVTKLIRVLSNQGYKQDYPLVLHLCCKADFNRCKQINFDPERSNLINKLMSKNYPTELGVNQHSF